jgi:hypothetical protein
MIPWRIELHANPDGTGALIDADVGGEPVITISNHANSSIVVATTLMPRISLGIYEYDQTNDIAGQSYDASYAVTVNGETVSKPFNSNPRLSGADSWYYSDRAGVATVLDAATIRVLWDMDDDGTEDAGAMLADGITSDSDIDLYLAKQGNGNGTGTHFVADLTAVAPYIVPQLAKASNLLTIYNGWIRRGLQEADFAERANRPANGIAGMMSGFKPAAEEILDRIAIALSNSAGNVAVQAIVPTREQGCFVSGLGWTN